MSGHLEDELSGSSFARRMSRGWLRLRSTPSHPASPLNSPTAPSPPSSHGAAPFWTHAHGRRVQAVIARLPPELWLQIFALASRLPSDPLDVQCEQPWDTRNFPPHLMLNLYVAAMESRRAFCLINRRLHGPAMALLLQYVWLFQRGQAQRLARLLRSTPARGSLIRRLDVDVQSYNSDAIQCSALDIRDIVSYTDGLVSFTDRHSTYTNVGQPEAQFSLMVPRLAQRNFATLGRVHVSYYQERLPWTALVDPLAPCPHLHTLEIDLATGDWQSVAATSSSLSFRNVRALELYLGPDPVLDRVLSTIASWSLPRIHTLKLRGHLHTGPGLAILLATHGTKLFHLELESPCPAASSIASLVPNLRVLTVTAFRGWNPPHTLVPAHPSIERINVRSLDALVASQHHGDVLRQVGYLNRARFPSLSVIRVFTCVSGAPSGTATRVNQNSVMYLFWQRWVEGVAHDGIVVQNIFGVPIRSPLGAPPPPQIRGRS